jgi:hypothetical protein
MTPVDARPKTFRKLGTRLAVSLVAIVLAILAVAPAQASPTHVYYRQSSSAQRNSGGGQSASGNQSSSRAQDTLGQQGTSPGHPIPHRDGVPANPPGGPKLPATGAWFGANAWMWGRMGATDQYGALTNLEDAVGRTLAVVRTYYQWNDVFPSDFDYFVRDRGQTPILSWQSSADGVATVSWADIASGKYDSTIDARAAGLKAYASPLIFSFQHEPEGQADPADFVAAFRHIHDRFVADGVTNVSYVVILLGSTYRAGDADQWYPGNAYVDLVGADGYNFYSCPGHSNAWMTFSGLFTALYNYGVAKGKPTLIAEFASMEDPAVPGAKAQWITDAAATLKTWPQMKAVAWYDKGSALPCAWQTDTSASSLAAFKTMGEDPYFNPVPPLVDVTGGPEEVAPSTTATFTFDSNVPNSTFTCARDAVAATPCISGVTYNSLGQGPHTLKIVVTDPVSHQSTSNLYPWSVDSVKPVITISWGPTDFSNDVDPRFHIASSEPVPPGTFTCKLDAGATVACGVWHDYFGLANGSHTFTAMAYDEAGNASVPVVRTWTVDTVAPTATIKTGPANPTTSKTATFTFTSSQVDSTFKCQLDGVGSFTTCVTPKTYNGLKVGTHTFKVESIDPAKNVGTTVSWIWTVT